jgi:hypothetical protein
MPDKSKHNNERAFSHKSLRRFVKGALGLLSIQACLQMAIAQEDVPDSTAPILQRITISPDSINTANSAQSVSVELSFLDENPVTTNTFYLENITSNQQIPLTLNGNWTSTNNTHSANFTASVSTLSDDGIWFVSGLVARDSENNSNERYDTLEELITSRLAPFMSVNNSNSIVPFDAVLSANPALNQTGNAQSSTINVTVQDAVEYEVWFVPNEGTVFTDIDFSGAISLAQACSIFDNFAKCIVTSSNNNAAITALVSTTSDDINSFGYSAFLQPTATSFEAQWHNNYIEFPLEDFDNDGIPNEQDPDDDNDNVLDIDDLFPFDPLESTDFDNDGIGDFADTDDDNDDVPDDQDAFPFDPLENADNDNDGQGNNSDLDDDNDGVLDSQDAFPFDPTETIDTDADGIGNNTDTDDDNDGGLDVNDAFPLDPTETIDSDGDGIGNNADPDDDNDGTDDVGDAFPRDPTEQLDTDEDGIGNNTDDDDDNDGVRDVDDLFPLDPGDFADNDLDGLGNSVDPDDDNDLVLDFEDAFPFNPSESADNDGDGIGNNADLDDDNDGLDDQFDRFPFDAGETSDFDGDGIGNNADNDDDNDGVLDNVDAFPFAVSEWFDTDNDGIGNNADPDNDNDGVLDQFDAFENDPTETQDFDNDGIGNNADPDDDNDGVNDNVDAFPFDANESLDTDNDGIGNEVDDDDDGDRVLDVDDLFPLDSSESRDNDLDGVGNNADLDDDNDGVLDVDDAFDFDPSETLDFDLDGIGDNADLDDDADGFNDDIDVFPFDITEWLDSDGDGAGDNRDTDDDNDGVLDTQDAFPFDPSETLDFDQDGIGNNADTDDDNDGVLDDIDAFPFAPGESVDSDGDGIGNNADPDDDNDGIVDEDDEQPLNPTIGDNEAPVLDGISDFTIEATGPLTSLVLTEPRVRDNNLNPASLENNYTGPLPVGEHIITWTSVDFAGNQTQLNQTITIEDTTAPEFSNTDPLLIAARGIFTDVSQDVNISAIDLVDGAVLADIVTTATLKSGRQSVFISATDAAGNTSMQELFLNILPSIQARTQGFASPGSQIRIPLTLSGMAAQYPVTVDYTIVGPVTNESDASLQISEGQQAELVLDVSPTAQFGQQIWVSFANPVNASLTELSQVQIGIDNVNRIPIVDIKLRQNDMSASLVYQNSGTAVLTANINDVNVSDRHNVDWQVSRVENNSRIDISDLAIDNDLRTFEFSPSALNTGNYIAKLTVSESNTIERHSVSLEYAFTIESELPPLSALVDSDFDGVSDFSEGVIDSDQDGIPDYLDNEGNTTILPTGASEQPLTVENGYRITVGDIAKLANNNSVNNSRVTQADIAAFGSENGGASSMAEDIHFEAIQQINNFNIENLQGVGESVRVVIPLNTGTEIIANTVYRKYNSRDGWFTFVENSNNAILSASFDRDGNCPEPNDMAYSSGLNVGDTCILLVIQDGGPNDSDLLVNGMIKDPGVLALQGQNTSPNISVPQQVSVLEGDLVRVDASLTTDVEGDRLVYTWQQTGGLPISIGENSSPLLSFIAPQVTQNQSLRFRLDVFDGRDTSSVNVSVTIRNSNTAPSLTIENHGATVNESSQFTLVALASDDEGDFLSYQWRQTSGPQVNLVGANTASLLFSAPDVSSNQSVSFTVFVSDGDKEVSATTTITIVDTSAPTQPSTDDDGGGGSVPLYLFLILLPLIYMRRHAQSRTN